MAAWLEILIAIAIPMGGSFVISGVTGPPGDWYKALNKPSWTPPGWAFPVVWTILYILMGVASWLVWSQGGFKENSVPLGLYLSQLALNFLWTPIFFGLHLMGWALAEILLMWCAILATIVAFWGVSTTAGILLLPYICWVSVATALNYTIYVKNPRGGPVAGITQPLNPSQ